MSQQTILVIGATGTVGAPVARQLREDGYQVRLLVRDPKRAAAQLGSASSASREVSRSVKR